MAVLWPASGAASFTAGRAAILVAAGIALLTLSAKTNLPLPYVPMTLQTLVVLVLAAAYGWRLGAATVLLYLAAGAAGLPVFAGPAGGLNVLFSATAGFLFGFVAAALMTGWLAERGWDRSIIRLFAVMAFGHAIILCCGWAWLAFGIALGPAKAFAVGVLPFLAGAALKTILGAVLIPLAYGAVARRRN
jgi:biotin transport system substrate-specific component